MKAWSVWYTSSMATPCLSTLSRSTSAKSCGTSGDEHRVRRRDLGALARLGEEALGLLGQELDVPPERSSSMKVTPPAVPTPGMAGGGNAKASASGSFASSRLMCSLIAAYCSSGSVRSPHSSKVTKKKAL
jgi:hypothetical protein